MQNENMGNEREQLSERFLGFGASIIKLVVGLNRTSIGQHIGMQLGRSATSAGANYEEACGAESRADFIHKMQLVLKESRESIYWLRLIKKADLISSSNLEKQIQEANELANIIAKSIVTAKNRK